MSEARRIRHPGPVAAERVSALACGAERRAVRLGAGVPLLDALEAAALGRAAWVDLSGLAAARLAFVQPAPAPGDGHAAWYSGTRVLEGARILRAGAHLGRKDGAAFAHVHGLWAEASGARRMGHLLARDTVLAEAGEAEMIALDGAGLEAAPDPETRFDLFRPAGAGGGPGAVLATVRPNEELHAAVEGIAREAGMARGRVMGLGSLVGARFEGGAALESYATEVLLTGGAVEGGAARLEAAAVGFDGRVAAGRLARGNAVCVTFELLLMAG